MLPRAMSFIVQLLGVRFQALRSTPGAMTGEKGRLRDPWGFGRQKIIQEPFFSSRSCELSASLLARVGRLRAELVTVERSLQEKHLRCCVFSQLTGAEEITGAVSQLSASRTGALIAVEQEMSLEDYTKTGTVINAELNATLLLSLFYPGNPLHDGAVIVRKERIVAAGCILPLSADHDTFKSLGLGTRHRAGVGLSQVSDATVFIVSEQTGRVSLAAGGQMFQEPLLSNETGSLKLIRPTANSR